MVKKGRVLASQDVTWYYKLVKVSVLCLASLQLAMELIPSVKAARCVPRTTGV